MSKLSNWSLGRADKPDAVAEDTTPTLAFFFKLLWRKAGKLLTLNLLMVLQFIPLVVAGLVYILGPTAPTVESALYAPLLGTYMAGNSPAAGTLLGVFGQQLNVPVPPTGGRLVVIILMIALTVLTWGFQSVGYTYNLRSLVRGDSCFLVSDYFYAIKRNLKQAFFFGLLDAALLFVLIFDIVYFYPLSAELSFGFMYILTLVLAVLYLTMRFYVYPMMITFDLSVRKLLKNALIFTTLGIKRNLSAWAGLLLVVGLNVVLIIAGLSVGFSVPLVLPFFYLPALLGFITNYAAYPVIQRYMIDPYTKKSESEEAAVAEEEA